MNGGRRGEYMAAPRQQGFILIEVMVATVLLTTLLGALAAATQTAWDGALSFRDRAASLSKSSSDELSSAAWEWGERVEAAHWRAGPELNVIAGAGGSRQVMVGVWAAGWLLGEWGVDSQGLLRLGVAVWQGNAGEELVIRARADGGVWGPPWRTVVPDAYGFSGIEAEAHISAGPVDGSSQNAVDVAHLPSSCSPILLASWSDAAVLADSDGVAFVLTGHTLGVCRLEFDGRVQTWCGDEGRNIDVYF